MPDWKQLGSALAADAGVGETSPIDALSAYQHQYSRPRLVERLQELLLVGQAQPGAAHEAFCRLPFDIVATTNFDFLLEDGYRLANRQFRVILNDAQLPLQFSSEDQVDPIGRKNTTLLLKIHGDLAHPSDLVVVEEDYDLFEAQHPLMTTFLTSLLIQRTPLFIGYSLEDPDLRHLWALIGSRLSKLRRRAYVLSFSAGSAEIARYDRRGVQVISL